MKKVLRRCPYKYNCVLEYEEDGQLNITLGASSLCRKCDAPKKLFKIDIKDTMKKSAGILLYNKLTDKFLILHPSGDYNKTAPWTIPKGEIDKEIDLDFPFTALPEALRELQEETGIELSESELSTVSFIGTGTHKSKSKRTYVFLVVTDREFDIVLDWENDMFKWVDYPTFISMCHESHGKFMIGDIG